MGNTQKSYSEKFYSKYSFIEMVHDQNFGQIKVYRKKQMNFDYVMILDRYMDEQSLQQVQKDVKLIHQSFLKVNEPMLLKVLNYEISKKSAKECGIPMIRLYIQFFNFTLADLMRRHQQNGDCFTYEQHLYILNSIINTYLFCSEINSTIFTCSPSSVFLSPEGFLKFSPIRVRDFVQQPDALCNALCHPSYKSVLIYDNNHKDFLNEFKKLFFEISRLHKIKSYRNMILNAKQMFTLKRIQGQINASRTLNQIIKVIPQTSVDGLIMNSKSSSEMSLPTSEVPATRQFIPLKQIGKKSMKNMKNRIMHKTN